MMGFICPDCGSHALEITGSLELPPGGDDDEITLQTIECAACGLCALGMYRESRRGALDSESWHHDGFRVSVENFQAIADAISRCPRPADRRCHCPSHQWLGQTQESGWDGLEKAGVKILGVFIIRSVAR
jgi:hypothetical protein